MKRDRYTIADISGLESEEQLKEYNKWLMHPQRPFGISVKKFKKEQEELNTNKRKKNNG